MVDSSIGSVPEAGPEYDSAVEPGSELLAGSVLGMRANSDSAHSVTEEFVLPTILQSTEGNFQHYDC